MKDLLSESDRIELAEATLPLMQWLKAHPQFEGLFVIVSAKHATFATTEGGFDWLPMDEQIESGGETQ